MNAHLLSLDAVSFSYVRGRRRIPVLSDFSMTVSAGERVALLGESGSGKSTVLGLASGVRLPDEGDVTFRGQSLPSVGAAARAHLRLNHMAHIYQDFRLLPMLTAVENVAFVPRLKGVHAEQASESARSALRQVGMGHRLDHRPTELSGGEQQRVAIARALVSEPELLLADEPTGALDATKRDEVLALMFSVLPDAAVILVTHDPAVAERATRVITVDSNSLAGAATTVGPEPTK